MNQHAPLPTRRQTKTYLQELFARRGISPRTRYGQNFLIDLNLHQVILDTADLDTRDVVLEVGAGTGGLTVRLAESAGGVIAVEVDPRLAELASEATAELANVTLLQADVLKGKNRINPAVLEQVEQVLTPPERSRLKLVANLPFNVATPVITNLLLLDLPLVSMTVTIQKELADRLLARPGTKDYGSLAVWIQAVARVELIRRLPPEVFWPRPKVTSALVHVVPDSKRRTRLHDPRAFHDFVRTVFLHRRKNLRGVLALAYRDSMTKADVDRFLATHGLSTDVRAEQLSVEKLIELAGDLQAALNVKDEAPGLYRRG